MEVKNNLPNTEIICLLCGARKVNGVCPNGCNIPISSLINKDIIAKVENIIQDDLD